MRIATILPPLFLFACLRLAAQPSPGFVHFTAAEGLPSNFDIRMMTSDAEGFLWVGTSAGLARFDGRRFVPFNELQPSRPGSGPLPEAPVKLVFADSRGRLWLRFGLAGLYCLDLATFRHQFFEEKFWANDFDLTLSAHEDAGGNIWFCTPEGVAVRGNETGHFSFFPLQWEGKTAEVRDLCGGEAGELWVASRQGLFRFDTKKRQYEQQPLREGQISVTRVARDDEGLIWASSWYDPAQGFTLFDPRRRKVLRTFAQRAGPKDSSRSDPSMPANTDAQQIFPAGDTIWFATNSGGLCRFDKKQDRFFSYLPDLTDPGSINSTQVLSVYVDPFGNLWTATRDCLNQLPARRKTTRLLTKKHWDANSLIAKAQLTLAALPGNLMAFGTDEGVSLHEPGSSRFFNFTLPAYNNNNYNNAITAFANCDAQTFWVGTWSGLQRVDKRSGQVLERYVTYSNAGQNHPESVKRMRVGPIGQLLNDRHGVLWIASLDQELRRLKKGADFEYLDSLLLPTQVGTDPLKNRVTCFAEQDDETIFLGTKNGLVKFSQSSGKFQAVPLDFPGERGAVFIADLSWAKNGDPEFSAAPRLLGGQALLAIANDKAWRIDLKKNVARRVEPSFRLKNCLAILEDEGGSLWISSETGLAQIAPDEKRSVFYDSRNFLHDNSFHFGGFLYKNAAKDAAGNLWFAGMEGVTEVHPADFTFSDETPEVKIISLKINNLSAPLDTVIHKKNSLRLPFGQNNLSFQFAVLNSAMPALTRFAYRLDQGGEWVELGTQNTVNFSRLAPGSYALEVRAANSDGLWSEKTATLRLSILPPWWGSWGAYLCYLALLAAGIRWYLRFRENRLRLNHQLELEHQEAQRFKELDSFKNRFFTNITHEFRTPLTVILGSAEQLAVGSGQWAVSSERPAVQGKLGLIKRNGQNLLRLINQILDLAKLESNSLKINYVQGDVLPYLRYIAESLHSLSNAQNVMLKVESDSAKIVMDYDPERLLQIVHNLLSNAIKFTPSGGRVTLRLTVDGGRQTESGSVAPSAVLTVFDTGVGIPPEDLTKIFDRFYQAENQEHTKAGGTGIGLSLTKELVKAMGGDISVESEVGKGTTFTVRLPVTNQAAASDRVTPPSQRLPLWGKESLSEGVPLAWESHPVTLPPAGNSGGNLLAPSGKLPPELTSTNETELPSILLIEDNPDVVEYLASFLKENYQLDFAYNGRAGIEKALETVPDLILSDVMMPEKDGFEVCDFLKNDERTSHIPIVLLTAKADIESRIAGLRRGADAYLAKPFHQEELAVTLANLLELRRKLQSKYVAAALAAEPVATASATEVAGTMDPENEFLKKLRLIVEENLSDTALDGELVCRKIGMGRSNLHAKLSALTGMPISHFVRALRLRRAKELLQTSEMNVSEVAYEVGFDNPKYFTRLFSEEFGKPPSEFRLIRIDKVDEGFCAHINPHQLYQPLSTLINVFIKQQR